MTTHPHGGVLADEALLHEMGNGCSECFALLFHRYYRPVFSISFRILHDRSEAEDILQEVFLAIFLQQERFDISRGSVKTWILQFAYFKSLLRRRYLRIRHFYKQEEISELQNLRRASPIEWMGLSSAEWGRFVETGIATLTQKQRRVLELIQFEGCTLQETSKLTRETLANTRNLYYRGLKALRMFLDERTQAKNEQENVAAHKSGTYRFES